MSVPQRSVVVLGMSRSGTSAVTRVLELLGVHLGPPEALKPPSTVNPKGFYEHRRIVRINKELLAQLGGDWRDVPALPDGWAVSPDLDGLRARARRTISREFGHASLWGFKDPRTCLTLPFWEPLLPAPRVVLCHRSPAAVAGSLRVRDAMGVGEAMTLWGRYVGAALAASAHLPRIAVDYDALLEDPGAVVTRLAGFLGVPERAADAEVRRAVDAWLDRGLRHHREDVVTAEMPTELAALHAALTHLG